MTPYLPRGKEGRVSAVARAVRQQWLRQGRLAKAVRQGPWSGRRPGLVWGTGCGEDVRAEVARGVVDLADQLIAKELLVLDARHASGEVGILLEAVPMRQRAHVSKAREIQVHLHGDECGHTGRSGGLVVGLLGSVGSCH